jgi:cytochrome oxidase Cu insertion factor (SCO1/SenC/PrrC family)
VSGPWGARTALAALALVLLTTAAWWALALWPVGADAPQWLLRTRDVCFGVKADALPTAGGWLLLVGQPLGAIVVLVAVWGRELRKGMTLATDHVGGQMATGAVLALLAVGVASAVSRVRGAGEEPFSTGAAVLAAQLTRLNDPAPALELTDQTGSLVSLASFRGRPVIVAFAYAHCQTVCPLIVSDVLTARDRFERDPPAVLLVTLDPWRDTPSRLGSIARLWNLTEGAHVLSGAPETVERTLNAWRVPRARNTKSGEITHPSIVYVVGADGRITYAVTGNADAIAAAVRAL